MSYFHVPFGCCFALAEEVDGLVVCVVAAFPVNLDVLLDDVNLGREHVGLCGFGGGGFAFGLFLFGFSSGCYSAFLFGLSLA